MQKFCHNCGKQLVVGANFCSGCGTNLSSLAATPPPPPAPAQSVRPTFTPFNARNDDDVEDVDRLEHANIRINALQVEIVNPPRQGAESVGNVMNQGRVIGQMDLPPREVPPSVDPKAFMEDFRKEAGARNPNERKTSVEITA